MVKNEIVVNYLFQIKYQFAKIINCKDESCFLKQFETKIFSNCYFGNK
jgi:hypothetical protein